jgi:hypothetical protein
MFVTDGLMSLVATHFLKGTAFTGCGKTLFFSRYKSFADVFAGF